MNAIKLYKTFDQATLLSMSRTIESVPENLSSDGSIHKYTLEVRRKLDAIDRAIAWHMEDSREIARDPVAVSGYTGTQRNRR